MFVSNIASLAVARETCDPQQLAKRAIFATDMLQESCLKFYLEQLSYNISIANISSLKVINDIKFHIDINKKSPRVGFYGDWFQYCGAWAYPKPQKKPE